MGEVALLYRVLADGVVLLHAGFLAFVIFGGLLLLRSRRWAWVHLPAVLWGVAVELLGWICPLTPLEDWLRRQAGDAVAAGDFIGRTLAAALYPEGLSRGAQVALGLLAIAWNAGLYAWALRRPSGPAPTGGRR